MPPVLVTDQPRTMIPSCTRLMAWNVPVPVYCEAKFAPLSLDQYMLEPLSYQNLSNTLLNENNVPVPGTVTDAQFAPPLVDFKATVWPVKPVPPVLNATL